MVITKIKKQVFCKFNVDGTHNWETFPIDSDELKEVAYLKNLHRHRWYFECYKTVNHDDRDIEFIWLQHEIEEYLGHTYWDSKFRTHSFGSQSCEMIGEEILNAFDLDKVVVSEDNENGAIITKEETYEY